jgi:hypothetical protein
MLRVLQRFRSRVGGSFADGRSQRDLIVRYWQLRTGVGELRIGGVRRWMAASKQ